MQSLVVRFVKDVTPSLAYTVNVPIEYKSVEDFLIDYFAWCVENSVTEFGFLNLGLQPTHGATLEVLSLEEWFWKYKKTIAS